MARGKGGLGHGRPASTTCLSRRVDEVPGGMSADLPIAPGSDALRRRLERHDPPVGVVVLSADAVIEAENDPRGRADVSVLEMPAAVNSVAIDWSAVEGLEVLVLVDGLTCPAAAVVDAISTMGAARVETITGPLGPWGDR